MDTEMESIDDDIGSTDAQWMRSTGAAYDGITSEEIRMNTVAEVGMRSFIPLFRKRYKSIIYT